MRGSSPMNEIVRKAKAVIQKNYNEIKSVDEIAKKLVCNYNTLRAVFVRESGETLIFYLNKIRCMHAAQMLQNTNSKLYSIAVEVGFTDESYFVKVFKKYNGKCPDQYRKELSN